MKIDALKQFARLREALISEKTAIEARLQELNGVLGAEPAQTVAAPTTTSLHKVATDYLEKNLAGYTPRPGTLPAKILKTLEKSGSGMQVKDIAAAVKGKAMLVNQACLVLLKKGRVRREGRGLYALA
jgi:hypothetical protein